MSNDFKGTEKKVKIDVRSAKVSRCFTPLTYASSLDVSPTKLDDCEDKQAEKNERTEI